MPSVAEPRSIVIVSHAWYGDTIGGAFRLASEFAEDLAGRGHRVAYICCAPDADGSFAEHEQADGVDIHRYRPPTNRRSRWQRLSAHVSQTQAILDRLIAAVPIDAVSGHSPLQFAGAVKSIRGRAVHVNYTIHSPFDDELASNAEGAHSTIRSRLAVAMARRVERRNLHCADTVQTDSQYTLDTMVRKYGDVARDKGIVAPGWVDSERFRPVTDRHATRQSLGPHWQTELPVFFTLRRLEARMGLETLIDAASQLQANGHQFRVLIGGGGSLAGELNERIRDAQLDECVCLLGRLAEEHLPACYATADCFVLPTRALECFGLIVLEAFAAGTPVIASDVAAIPELVAAQGRDWLFPSGDVNALTARMSAFLSGEMRPDCDLRAFATGYDRSKVSEQWERILLEGIESTTAASI